MTDDQPSRQQNPWYLRFHDLMPFRVREILLVSSPYDAFTLEEDGRLTERIFTEYSELNLTSAPRVTHVSTGARALELFASRRFDLVVTMVRIADTDVSAFGRRIKAHYPNTPVVLLVLTEGDLRILPGGVDPAAVDHVFWWTGDARILVAIVKLVEDERNTPHDTETAGVRVIIVVEDSVRRYSSFLSLLYAELMIQSGSLVAEGVNDLLRLLRMRARHKVVLAKTYEEAVALFSRYRRYTVALISDVRFPRGGEADRNAGFALVETVRRGSPDLPVMLQSAEPSNAARAAAMGVHYVDKGSQNLLGELRRFVTESLGFGDFVFRMPDRTEVGRARDVFGLQELLRTVPGASIQYHATRNHFSLWLMARCMFRVAEEVRPRTVEEFGDAEGLRKFLLLVIEDAQREQQEGVIADFSTRQTGPQTRVVRLGRGSLGGKARGIAFISTLLARHGLDERVGGLSITVPRSVVVPTDEFDRFVEENRVLDGGLERLGEREVRERCLSGQMSEGLMNDITRATAEMRGPLAIRSSSLLEDSQLQPFAGIYETYMLPNNHPNLGVRRAQIFQAIKAVWASTFSADARAYVAGTSYSLEEEKMAVLIQQIVGRGHGPRFYPDFAGVAVSYNYYPVGHQRAQDGLAMVALGLGHTVVQGGASVQFSPGAPTILPQFGTAQDYLRYGQSRFFALDLGQQSIDFDRESTSSLQQHDLRVAEEDGTLRLVGSTYCPDDDTIRDALTSPGPRVVTFNNILKWNSLPLAQALAEILPILRDGLLCPVEVEFAVDAGDLAHGDGSPPRLALLQVRPQATLPVETEVSVDGFAPSQVLCRTDRSLGNGVIDGIRDVVFVKRDDLQATETPQVAEHVGRINALLVEQRTPYLLVGPGRWGSSDPRLGIPVRWAQIAGARVIIETSFRDRDVEPSLGAHFFHNVTAFRIGYLTILRAQQGAAPATASIDLSWLGEQPVAHETAEVCHVRLEHPLRILLDGRKSAAVVLKSVF